MPSLEIACFTPLSAQNALSSAASRIELCTSQSLGGTTPSLSTFLSLSHITIPINVMIRPQGSNFLYTASEFATMESSVQSFNSAGASGFVFGILDADGKVDRGRNQKLVRLAGGKGCTFHRAFDEIAEEEMESQLELLIECGFKAVLTSGGALNAIEGKERLRKLVKAAKGRIEIIVGGGVRSSNVDELRETGASWFHSSAVTDGGENASAEEVKLLCSKLGI